MSLMEDENALIEKVVAHLLSKLRIAFTWSTGYALDNGRPSSNEG